MSERAGAVQDARWQRRVDELTGAAVRALAGDPLLRFRNGRLHRDLDTVAVRAPHLHPTPGTDDFTSFRGAADALALRQQHSDDATHREAMPDDPVGALVFDLLEQVRVESLAELPGVLRNLRHRQRAWSTAFHESGLTETESGMLLFALVQVARARICAEPVRAETEDLIEAARFHLAGLVGNEMAQLRAYRADQRTYAVPALAVARKVAADVDQMARNSPRGTVVSRNAFQLLHDQAADDEVADSAHAASRSTTGAGDEYRVFTTGYDRELDATDVVRPDALGGLRARLDDRIAAEAIGIARLARRFQRLLAEPVRDGWEDGQESGVVDGRRLTQLIASPTERRLFRTEPARPVADTVVSFLIDCSGSMRRHHESIAVTVDVCARALDLAGVSSEVLGYTTGAWNGGRAIRDWRRAGRPASPGRLNERLHLVLKDADTRWRTARQHIAALLRPDIYREAIDGEAVAWACGRLRHRPEARRILIVVSDGSPMDSATHLTNGPAFLDQHLHQVLRTERALGAVRVVGLSVGLDLSAAFEESRSLDLEPAPEGVVTNLIFDEILALLAGRQRR